MSGRSPVWLLAFLRRPHFTSPRLQRPFSSSPCRAVSRAGKQYCDCARTILFLPVSLLVAAITAHLAFPSSPRISSVSTLPALQRLGQAYAPRAFDPSTCLVRVQQPGDADASKDSTANATINGEAGQSMQASATYKAVVDVGAERQESKRWSCDSASPSSCSSSEREPCLYGRGLCEAKVMEPARFFIETKKRGVKCYARTTGAGIILPTLTHIEPTLIQVDYVSQEEGEFLWWVMCSNIFVKDRPWPKEASVMPWHHYGLSESSPITLTVTRTPTPALSPPSPPRLCGACTGASIGNLSAQWIRTDTLRCQCGPEALGAIDRWFWDDYVWAPRECLFQFRTRDEFVRQMAGVHVALVGDSTVRGMYADLVNWLQGVGPEILQVPGYTYDVESGASSWDGIVAGFNPTSMGGDRTTVHPNPIHATANHSLEIRYFPAYEARQWPEALRQVRAGSYDVVLLNFGLWVHSLGKGSNGQQVTVPEFVRTLINTLLCPEEERHSLGCNGRFRGRIVYRTSMAKFDPDNFCQRQAGNVTTLKNGVMCKQNEEVMEMLHKNFRIGVDGDLVILDAFDITYSRPDRSQDSYHFFPRKCSAAGRSCTQKDERNILGCCWEPNRFPHSASLSLSNVFVNMIWDDPLVHTRSSH